MKLPSRHILKTVTEIPRHAADLRNHNLHIGRTLCELEMRTEGKSNEHLQGLLENLEAGRAQSSQLAQFPSRGCADKPQATTTGHGAPQRRGTKGANRRSHNDNARRSGGWSINLG
ncbi:hypothetical protein ABIA24_003143 [Sinorhizobium fredii]